MDTTNPARTRYVLVPRSIVTLDEECERASCLCHAMRALGLAFGHYGVQR